MLRIKRYITDKKVERTEKLLPEDERIKKALDICDLSRKGKSTTDISKTLKISQSTVVNYTKKFCPTVKARVGKP